MLLFEKNMKNKEKNTKEIQNGRKNILKKPKNMAYLSHDLISCPLEV